MSRHPILIAFVMSSLIFSLIPPGAQAAEFRATGFSDLSDNGHVVVTGGGWRSLPDGVWQEIPRAVPIGPWYWDAQRAYAATADGARVYLSCQVDEHYVWALRVDDIAPFVFESGTHTLMPRLHDAAYPLDVTPSGDIVVGCDFEYESAWLPWEESTFRAVRWVNGAISQLEELSAGLCGTGDDDQAIAVAISDDGTIIVGNSGERGEHARPVVWINGVVSRLDPFGPTCGIFNGQVFLYPQLMDSGDAYPVRDLSGDGRFAVGLWTTSDGSASDALYWPIDTRIGHLLARLHPGDTHAGALCISRRGDRIGGFSRPASATWDASRGVIWERTSGVPQDVMNILQAVGLGEEIAGWKLLTVKDMSADGKQIAGDGINPQGQHDSWWADLRDPPGNDTCAGAARLDPNHGPYMVFTGKYQATGTTRDASWDGAATCVSTTHENTNVWYKYTAPVDGYLMLDLCDSPLRLLDEYMSVHTGCPGTAANEILCLTDCPHRRDCGWPCVQPPELLMNAGQTYYIQVGGWSDDGHDIVLSYRFLPLNDDCADAFSVGHNPSSTPGSTENMTVDTGADCQGVSATAPGVWYTVLGTGTTMTASTCGEGGDANFDTQISVFCSGCGGQTCVAANDDSEECSGTNRSFSSVTWCSSPGALYHILVHGYGTENGIFELAVTDDGQSCPFSINCHPPNETCGQAMPVSDGTTMGDNTGANTVAPAASCATTTNDVWFHYRTRCDGRLWVDTCQLAIGSMNDSVISFYDGCSGTELACNDDYQDSTINCQHRSAAIGSVYQEQDILIRVAGYGPNQLNQGTFPLRVSEVAAPLTIVSGPVLPDGALAAPYAHQLAYHGSCGMRFTTATGLPPGLGVDYFSGQISGTPQSAGDFSIHVDVCNNDVMNSECTAANLALRIWPTNDACANAMPVSEGLHYFGNAGATTDGPDEPIECTSGWRDTQVASDVWYRYTSSCDGRATVDLCASAYDTKLALYQGAVCPVSEGASACNDDICNLQSRLDIAVAGGAEYLIRIGGYNGEQGIGAMLLTCINDCNGNLVSDAEEIALGVASDCNYNTRRDACDVRGDYNADGVPNLYDLPVWLGCLWGPCAQGVCSTSAYSQPCCEWIDYQSDGDVDLKDLAALQRDFGR